MNPIIQALSSGYTASNILKYFSSANPQLASKIKTALASGYAAEKVLKYVMKGGKNLSKDLPSSQGINTNLYDSLTYSIPEDTKQLGKTALGLAATAAGVGLGLKGASIGAQAIGSLGQEASQMPSTEEAPIQQEEPTVPTGERTQEYLQRAMQGVEFDKLSTAKQNRLRFINKQIADAASQGEEFEGKTIQDLLKTRDKVLSGEGLGLMGQEHERFEEGYGKQSSELIKSNGNQGIQDKKEIVGGVPIMGKPFTFDFVRNKTPSSNMGERFGQHIEPAGRYMTQGNPEFVKDMPWMQTGQMHFKNPLVIDFGEGYQSEKNWKKVISNRYGGKTGKELSQAIVNDGYDGIVTVEKDKRGNEYTSEIIDLTSFNTEKISPITPTKIESPSSIKKGESVVTENEGLAQVKGISGNKFLIEENGKLKQVPMESLRAQPEAIKNAKIVFDPNTVPEQERSSNLAISIPMPDRSSIINMFHDGTSYIYRRKDGKPIDESIIRSVIDGLEYPISSGETFMGMWNTEKGDSRGATVMKDLVRQSHNFSDPDDPSKPLVFEKITDSFTHGYLKEFMKLLKESSRQFSAKPKKEKKKRS